MAETITIITFLVVIVIVGLIRTDVPVGIRNSRVAWVLLSSFSVAGLITGFLELGWDPLTTVFVLVGVISVGIISPEIILAVGQGVANFLRRAIPYVTAIVAVVGLYFLRPDLFGSILVLCVICLGIWVMIRPIIRG